MHCLPYFLSIAWFYLCCIFVSHPATQKFENVITKHLVFFFNVLLPPKFETITQRNHWLFAPITYFLIVAIKVFSILFHFIFFRTWIKACIKSSKCHIITHLAHQIEPMIWGGIFCIFHCKGLIAVPILIPIWIWF